MEWINVKDRLPEEKFERHFVKKENGEEKKAYFMPDKMEWISYYGLKSSFWMETRSGQLIHDVTHWRNE